MTTDEKSAEDAHAVAVATSAGRDGPGCFCHILQLAIMAYFVIGWALPGCPAFVFYVEFVPAVTLRWQFNNNACVLGNIESPIRSGRWRDPSSRGEGAWLATLAEDAPGFRPTPLAVDVFTGAILPAF